MRHGDLLHDPARRGVRGYRGDGAASARQALCRPALNGFGDTDTTDLRTGPELDSALLALLPLVGVWQGVGRGVMLADGVEFDYRHRITFSHNGRPFLAYQSATFFVDDGGTVTGPAAREAGFWRPGVGPDDVEVVLALSVGIAQTLIGRAGDAEWELGTAELAVAPAATPVAGEKRFYAVRGDRLSYARELAIRPGEFAPHQNSQLTRAR